MRKSPVRKARPDHDRAIFAVLHAIKDMKASEVAKKSFVSASTVYKWRKGWQNGGTRFPQHMTLAAVARIAGFKWELVAMDEPVQKPVRTTRTKLNGVELRA